MIFYSIVTLLYQYAITTGQVSLIYTMCQYDTALEYGELSPWCAAFSDRNLLVFEYVEDLL